MQQLSHKKIQTLISRPGVDGIAVEYFMGTVKAAGTKEDAILNLYKDARRYNWNISTINAIEKGIKSVFVHETGSASS